MRDRGDRLIWIIRGFFVALFVGLIVYLTAVGLDKADKVASVVAAVAALISLAATFWIPPRSSDPRLNRRAVASGEGAVAVGGANHGSIETHVTTSRSADQDDPGGDLTVRASGDGAVAVGDDNSGPVRTDVQRQGDDAG